MKQRLPFRAEGYGFAGTRDFSDIEQAREWLKARGGGTITRRSNYRPGHSPEEWEFVERIGDPV